MQEKRKRSKASIIIAVAAVVLLIVVMVVWRQYEAKHKDELEASVLTTDVSQVPIEEEPEPEPAKPARVIPDDPEKLIVMVEEAFKDEGYFDQGDILKGFHVYSLLKKCLDCNANCDKVAEMVNRLKERSSKTYGAWHVERDLLVDLEDSLNKAREQI